MDFYEHAEKTSLPSVEFHFSGGEPLLSGIDFMTSVIQLQKKHNANGIKVVNSIQTNGTLLNEEWAHFFKSNGFGLSISLDGPEHIQDKHRRRKNGEGSSKGLVRCLDLLHEINFPFGLISVITKDSVPHAESIMRFLLSCRPVNIVFLPCADTLRIENTDWAEFMIKAFDIWIDPQINANAISERSFRTILLHLCGMPPHGRACDYAPDCLYPNISPDGNVSICDQFVGKPDGYLGDLKTDSLSNILQYKKALESARNYLILPRFCKDCVYRSLCCGGCAYRRSMNHGLDYLCESRKRIFEHIDSKVDGLLESLKQKLMQQDQI